jgi:murein DD-endopeptidase MepM/ murein hydrolase activator NlpD
MLWREAGIAALVCGALTACASPAYPISEDQRPGPAPLTMARPAYPISEEAPQGAPSPAARSNAVAPQPAPAVGDEGNPTRPPLSAPIAPVESQPLPAPGASSSAFDSRRSDGARLQYASLSTQQTPVATSATATSAAPVSTSLPAAAPSTAATTPAATAPATTPPAAAQPAPAQPAAAPPPAEPALMPQMVVHDQPGPAAPASGYRPSPVREAAASTIDHSLNAPNSAGLSTAGDVVGASGDIFENYEVQRGDHIDALARAFSTSRDTLIRANHIRSPFTIHPGEIVKVPVAKAYVARSGDTLPGVARRFAVGVDELAQLNHISTRAALQPGQEIGLPSSMRDRGPQAAYAATTPTYRTEPAPPPRRYGQIQAAEPTQAPPHATYGYQTSQPPGRASGSVSQVAPQLSDSEIAQAAHGRFVWPIRGDMLARFGAQGVGRRNDGIDIRASQGTAVKAAASGEVVYAGNQVPGFGNLVLIKHPDGWVTAYAHLDQVDVQMKQQVSQGQAVGSVGTSGGATEPELHFEVRYAPSPADKARPVDPVLVLPLG